MGMNRRRAIGLMLLALLLPVLGGPSRAADGAPPPPGRFGIGDSIMLSASDELAEFDWDTNAEVGRQFDVGVKIANRKSLNGSLPKRVIVHLGTNGPIDPADCDALVVAVGEHRRLFLVSIRVPRGWEESNNRTLNDCAARYPKVHMIRWYAYTKDHPEWFSTDGYHLNVDGQAAYASFLDSSVDEILAAVAAAHRR
jgi:hypothetical protein